MPVKSSQNNSFEGHARKGNDGDDAISIHSSPYSAATLNSSSTFRLTPYPAGNQSPLSNITSSQLSPTSEFLSLQPHTQQSPSAAARVTNRQSERKVDANSLTLTKKASANRKKKKAKDTSVLDASPPIKKKKLQPPKDSPAANQNPAKRGVSSVPAETTLHGDPRAKENKKAGARKEAKDKAETKKKKKITFQDQVMNHMLNTFKPFTLKTLASELKTTSEALNYVMLSLTDKALVTKKDFTSKSGKVKTLYWANYGAKAREVYIETASQEKIASTRIEISKLQVELVSLRRRQHDADTELSDEELHAKLKAEEEQLVQTTAEVNATRDRIRNRVTTAQTKPFRFGPPKSAAQLAKERCPRRLRIRFNRMRDEWKSRKEKCVDFLDQLADGLEKKPREVFKLLEIETDEEAQASLPIKKANDEK